jgi:predicted DNA-binding protein with PD1-like motif
MKASFLFLLLISAELAAGPDLSAAQESWIAPAQTAPHGAAPGMKVQLLGESNGQKSYAVIFHTGDDAYSGLYDFARQYQVTAAHFSAIGALRAARIAWFDPSRKMYRQTTLNQQVEVLSMQGDVALSNGKPAVHAHMVVGLPDGTTRGGHVLEADVCPTLEVMVTVEPNAMHRVPDAATGLTLIDPQAAK